MIGTMHPIGVLGFVVIERLVFCLTSSSDEMTLVRPVPHRGQNRIGVSFAGLSRSSITFKQCSSGEARQALHREPEKVGITDEAFLNIEASGALDGCAEGCLV
jgi:hypothetical protein